MEAGFAAAQMLPGVVTEGCAEAERMDAEAGSEFTGGNRGTGRISGDVRSLSTTMLEVVRRTVCDPVLIVLQQVSALVQELHEKHGRFSVDVIGTRRTDGSRSR